MAVRRGGGGCSRWSTVVDWNEVEAVRVVVVVVVVVLHLVAPVGGALCRVARHAGAAAALRLACAAVCRTPTSRCFGHPVTLFLAIPSRCFGHPIHHPHLTSPRLTSPRQRLLSYFLLSPPFVLFFVCSAVPREADGGRGCFHGAGEDAPGDGSAGRPALRRG